MRLTPAYEIEKRIGQLQNLMASVNLDAVLVMQSADLFYLSGTFQNAFLFIPREGKPVLLVRRLLQRALDLSPLKKIMPLGSLRELPSILKENGLKEGCTLGLELDVLPVSFYSKIKGLFSQMTLADCSRIIREMRAIKSPYELEIIQDVAAMMMEAFKVLPGLIEVGKTEAALAGLLEAEMRKRGHQGLVRVRGFNQEFFFGCFLAGKSGGVGSFFDGPLGGPGLNPAYPIGHGHNIIRPNQPIIVDYVGAMEGYVVDLTRVFSLGPVSPKLQDAHKVAIEIQNEIVAQARPGEACSELYKTAMKIAGRTPYKDNFMGHEEPVRFVGHGVGIELNELPVLASVYKAPLQKGMVMAVEPKFIFPGEGAVGVENTFLVKENGLLNLTPLEDSIHII